MAEIDGSIPASIGKIQPVDPGTTISNITALQGQILNNRMLGQKLNAQNAIGRIVQSNIDDKGNFNPMGANLALKSSPDAAYMAGDAVEQNQKLATAKIVQDLTQSQADKAEVDANLQRLEPIYGAVTSLVADPKGDFSKQGTADLLKANLVDSGLVSGQKGLDLLNSHVAQLTDDPVKNRQMLANWGLQMKPTLDAFSLYRGPQQNLDTGPATVNMRPGGIAGGPQVNSTVQNALTPGQRGELVQLTDPATGATYAVPKGQLLDPYGNPSQGGGGVPSTGGGAPGPRNGRYPTGGAPGAVPGAIGQTGMAPGSAEVMQASAKAYNDDQAAVPNLKKVMTTFDQARSSLAAAPTGKGSDVFQSVRAVADTLGIPLDPKSTESYAEANKWLSSALTQEAGRLGLNTDAARELQAEAQPGTQTVHGAAVKMLPVLQGLKAMDIAAPAVAQKQGVTPQQYTAWRSQWANSLDPMAFSAPYMAAADRAAYVKSLGDPNTKKPNAKQKRYIEGLQAGIDAGLFTAADLGK